MLNKCAVCEGYANLYAALARSIDVKVQYIASTSMVHGWNKTYFDGDWRLTDLTWDDPSVGTRDSTDVDPAPGREYYEYFIIDSDKGHTAGDQAADTGRGGSVSRTYLGNALTGWY